MCRRARARGWLHRPLARPALRSLSAARRVLLHNDNYNRREYVVRVLLKVVEGFTVDEAVNCMQASVCHCVYFMFGVHYVMRLHVWRGWQGGRACWRGGRRVEAPQAARHWSRGSPRALCCRAAAQPCAHRMCLPRRAELPRSHARPPGPGPAPQEAHVNGLALVTMCAQETAERYVESLRMNGLISTLEPAGPGGN